MPGPHLESAFESHIVDELTSRSGWQQRHASTLDRDRGLIVDDLVAFLHATQPDKVEKLQHRLGGQWGTKLGKIVADDLDKRPGRVLDLLRHGKSVRQVHLDFATFRPTHGLNPDIVAKYEANQLSVMRQVPYSSTHHKTLDLALFVNGLPVATLELKTRDTTQSIADAITQYRSDRDPHEAFLSRRAVVHFAVDNDAVEMTTRLAGQATRFLPFNRGTKADGTGGAGNYIHVDSGHLSSYLWRDILQRDVFLDILARFIHIEAADTTDPAAPRTMIFPRYHQWDAVTRLEAAARETGSGDNYLVQHSAGSGKTNSIGWLAHRLATLHAGDDKVFDKVIVITDRRVLDDQLQAKIEQFERADAKGYVRTISTDSTALADALESTGAKVVVTTLQKFPYVLDKVTDLAGSHFAVIIDEAHSSQSGSAARDLRAVLSGTSGEEALAAAASAEAGGTLTADEVDEIAQAHADRRGKADNVSMFAFTATPKGKTLELFGTPTGQSADDGSPMRAPLHVYSMRQAIEEEFIVDVLANYMTYPTYYRLATESGDELTEKSRAATAAARYAMLHPHVIDQKVDVILAHFRDQVQHRLGGTAKAMVVTRSRLHAVRYKQAMDAWLVDHDVDDVTVMVAFSGSVTDPDLPGAAVTESSLNGFPESRTAKRFDSDGDVMVVAEKFQTGFDQPKLCAMYIDKTLSGVNAVQTLGRLNRSHPDKSAETVFVLDFVNDAETIQDAFEPYYEVSLGQDTDPQVLDETWERLTDHLVIDDAEVDAFAALWFTADRDDKSVNAKLQDLLYPAVERFDALDEPAQDDFRSTINAFNRMYAFLSQVLDWAEGSMEKAHVYTRMLARRVTEASGTALDLSDDLELTHFRIADARAHQIDLAAEDRPLTSFSGGGLGSLTEDELVLLSEIIDRLNERFGLDLGDTDKVDLRHLGDSLALDQDLQAAAKVNTKENFAFALVDKQQDGVLDMMDRNQHLGKRMMDDDDFARIVGRFLLDYVYRQARAAA